ncbi:MAG: GDSL-type esterase/lipase family protein [Hespellia sp.]|nr:GDSL-type esterase/lipase family protein [Hespellia sp.]
MKIDRRKIIQMILGAIVIAVALFAVIKIVGILTTKKVDTAEGIAIIKAEESQDLDTVENKIKKMEAQEKADAEALANRTDKQIFVNSVVMGDSITEAFTDYDILDPSSVISKIGVSVTDIDDALATVEQMNPDAIFLSYGMNDIISTRGDSGLFKEQYAKVIDELKEKLPSSRIFVNSIFPVQQQEIDREPVFQYLPDYNQMLATLCDEEQITFIDNTSLVKTEYYEEDGVHFTSEFYPLWAGHMAEVAAL